MARSQTKRGVFAAYSSRVITSKRWKDVRYLALKRDGFACVRCGAVGRLEVDHIRPVKDFPKLAFDLQNLQTLCRICHSAKTNGECGRRPTTLERQEWRKLLVKMF